MAVADLKELKSFYSGKKVFVTGHTGFKGTWLTRILLLAGAKVTGYSLQPPTEPNLFLRAQLDRFDTFTDIRGDVRDFESLKKAFDGFDPDVVLHLAAQPIVRDSYKDPRYTYETNVMGTVNLLECVRLSQEKSGVSGGKKISILNVTTDKVYKNNEWCYGYRENEPLDGYDPYSNSKSCSELATHSFINSFFTEGSVSVSTTRAGNVIGGGDHANCRIIPDACRAVYNAIQKGESEGVVVIRNPYSTRPYQHVLEPLAMYLTIAMRQYEDKKYAGFYNIGPDDCDCVTTGELIDMFINEYNSRQGIPVRLKREDQCEEGAPHEANFLKLDNSLIKQTFGWSAKWHMTDCIAHTVDFLMADISGKDVSAEMDREIEDYFL